MELTLNQVPPSLVHDRIVLIGSVAPSLKDLFYTPYSNDLLPSPKQNSGVEIQAHLTSVILSAALEGRPVLRTWSESVEVLWIFLWSSAGTALTWAVRFQGYRNYSLLRTVMAGLPPVLWSPAALAVPKDSITQRLGTA